MPDNRELEQEKRLIESAKEDPDNFVALYDKYVDQIYRYVYRRASGDKNVTHDLVSQTFLDALANIKKFQWQGYPFSSWLYKIAHNNVIRWYREVGKVRNVPLEEARHVSNKEQTQKQQLESVMAGEQIKEILSKLDDEEQEILRLKFFEELSNVEIADIMGLSVSNVGVKVFRTLKKAKGLLPSKKELKKLD
ncbi:RNA polymerase sigma factor [Patescibacteria group bacterium]